MSEKFDFSVMRTLKSSKRAEDVGPDREDAFRTKVAIQQFLNHNGPIFKAFAYRGIPVSEVTDGSVLVQPTAEAARLTKMVASRVLRKDADEVTAKEAAAFRSEAANWVARRWIDDEDYDVERAATQIAAALAQAGKDWDHDPFRDERITNDASIMMSAAGVTLALMPMVEIYDFRKGRNEVLRTLLDSVISTSIEVATQMLPASAPKADVSNLTQTVARNFSSILSAIYERKAREVIGLLEGKSVEQKVKWLEANQPLDDIISEFKTWALCFVGFAVAASERIANPQMAKAKPAVMAER